MTDKILCIVGPTASGKTRRAVECARAFHGEIISGDSRQVYRGMSIGTGKDLDEYGNIPYHLIDIREPGYKYNLYEFIRDFHIVLKDIKSRNKFPILCGGSGLYVESVLSGIILPDVPENEQLRTSLRGKTIEELKSILESKKTLHNITDVDSPSRAIRAIEIQTYYEKNPDVAAVASKIKADPIPNVLVGLDIPRDTRRSRITERLHKRMEEGMPEEIKSLLDRGVSAENLMYYGLEYKFVTMYVTGQISKEEMINKLEIAIHQFAKRQMTWFRGMERRGYDIKWLPWDLPEEEFIENVRSLINS